MKKFLKESSLFYGVVALLSLILFSRPSTFGTLTAQQLDSIGGIYGYFAVSSALLLVSLIIMSYLHSKVKYGSIKSIADNRFTRINNIVNVVMLLGFLILAIGCIFEVPKLCSIMGVGFIGVLTGESNLSFTVLGLFIYILCFIYAIIGGKVSESDLPSRRRSVKLVKIKVSEFLMMFIQHVPSVISTIVLITYLLSLLNFAK